MSKPSYPDNKGHGSAMYITSIEYLVVLICSFSALLFNSIQGALLTWETYVNIAKASEVDNIQK